jgi:hypothetical protein
VDGKRQTNIGGPREQARIAMAMGTRYPVYPRIKTLLRCEFGGLPHQWSEADTGAFF